MKTARQMFVESFRAERPKFLRVFESVPAKEAGYRPHPRSNSAGDLVWMIAGEWGDAVELMQHGKVDYTPPKASGNVREAVALFEKNAGAIEKRLEGLDDAAWDKKAQFLMDGKVAWEAPLGEMLFGFLFDAIHHRGQLSTYLRPMGAKVPSIYGPSADDPGQ
ncbi:MAG: DinB family protein [Syntrophomonadaceae bacterium]